MLRAAIFDLDGLLIDSEPHWRDAEIAVFAAVGVELTEEMCARTTGLRIDEVVAYWHARTPWAGPGVAEVTARVVAEVSARVASSGVAKPGVTEALAMVRGRGVPVGLASSSPLPLIRAAVARLGLEGAFDALCSAEAEAFGKPHPAVYLSCAARLGVPAPACVAIEDSVNGLVAAKAARMRCVVVPDGDPTDPRLGLADRVLPSLVWLTGALWDELDRA